MDIDCILLFPPGFGQCHSFHPEVRYGTMPLAGVPPSTPFFRQPYPDWAHGKERLTFFYPGCVGDRHLLGVDYSPAFLFRYICSLSLIAGREASCLRDGDGIRLATDCVTRRVSEESEVPRVRAARHGLLISFLFSYLLVLFIPLVISGIALTEAEGIVEAYTIENSMNPRISHP